MKDVIFSIVPPHSLRSIHLLDIASFFELHLNISSFFVHYFLIASIKSFLVRPFLIRGF